MFDFKEPSGTMPEPYGTPMRQNRQENEFREHPKPLAALHAPSVQGEHAEEARLRPCNR